ncbi:MULTISPECIES: Sua5/YciO/YrdC/YwlC family protein [Clostridium]|uniref:Kae1-like domain-containing protein n=1 Tax=Clostridium TaxID=1485 RepID=UPI001F60D37D|nr:MULTISPECIES: Sua5/YciO/YrdC/YwlC family protein [Clostridium]
MCLCDRCLKNKHKNPLNRLFHIEEICLKNCIPPLTLVDNKYNAINSLNIIEKAYKLLKSANILAIKDTGGFYLICNGKSRAAINTLRRRKMRQSKPFAVMMKDIYTVREFCEVHSEEKKVLESSERPIVILDKKPSLNLPNNISPNLKSIGVMLPFSPISRLMLQKDLDVLIITKSSNIELKNETAFKNLKNIADYFLIHNREISVPLKTPVVYLINHSKCVLNQSLSSPKKALNNSFSDNFIEIIYGKENTEYSKNFLGGEFFIKTNKEFKMAAHFQYVTLQGKPSPLSSAISYLHFFKYNPDSFIANTGITTNALEKNSNSCLSSIDHFFDCISSLLDIVHTNTYAGEAAQALESIADATTKDYYKYRIKNENSAFVIDIKNILRGVLIDILIKKEKSMIATKFHNTIYHITCQMALILSKLYGINKIILSGTTFQNKRLLEDVSKGLKKENLRVYFNSKPYLDNTEILL